MKSATALILSALATLLPSSQSFASESVRVLVWDERQPEQKQAYAGRFIGDTIAAHFSSHPEFSVKSVSFADPEQGVSEATLDDMDVVIWWSHKRNSELTDEHAQRIVSRVLDGKLGLIALHSAHWAKPFVHSCRKMGAGWNGTDLSEVSAERVVGNPVIRLLLV